jgi:methionyl aminopeptidase
MLKAGVDAADIDNFAERFGIKYGATPAFKTKTGYKYTINFSIDNEVTHGLPIRGRKVPENCLLKIDIGFVYNGMFSDAAVTYIIGNPPARDIELSRVTESAMRAGIATVRAGCTVGDIGSAIDKIAKQNGYGNIRVLGGHGLGYSLHDTPFVPHFGNAGKGAKLFAGKVITIEPMFNIGTNEITIDEKDGWTIRTADGSHSAQWECDIYITKDGCEVLTDIEDSMILPL